MAKKTPVARAKENLRLAEASLATVIEVAEANAATGFGADYFERRLASARAEVEKAKARLEKAREKARAS